MRWIPLIVLFLLAWLEISIFIKVASVIGIPTTMLLVVLTSSVGLSLVRKRGIRNYATLREKMANRENPREEIVKSVSLLFAGFLLLIPGFFTDFLGVLLLLKPLQRLTIQRFMPKFSTDRTGDGTQRSGVTLDGEFKRKETTERDSHDARK